MILPSGMAFMVVFSVGFELVAENINQLSLESTLLGGV